jgi:hypothetical protein
MFKIGLGVTTIFALLFLLSCDKDPKFLGQTDFQSQIILRSYTSTSGGYIRLELPDTVIERLDLLPGVGLQQILLYDFVQPKSGTGKVKITWKDSDTVLVDQTFTFGAINNYYLLELNPATPPTFYANLGGDGETPDSTEVKVRFLYERDTADAGLNFPDSVRLKFTSIYESDQTGALTVNNDDTASIVLQNGQISSYITLANSKYKAGELPNYFSKLYGYEVYDAKTGAKLVGYCTGNNPYNVLDYNSNEGGTFKTVRLAYNELAFTCTAPTGAPAYELSTIFGTN